MALMGQTLPEDKLEQVMETFEQARKGLAERYGPADSETGKYLDSSNHWYWGGNRPRTVYLSIVRDGQTAGYLCGASHLLGCADLCQGRGERQRGR